MKNDVVTEDGAGRHRKDTRTLSVGVGAILAIALLTVALVFTNAYGARQVAENARSLHWTNATLGAAALARAANAQAVVFTLDHQLGVADAPAAAAALAEAEATLAALEGWRERASEVTTDPPELAPVTAVLDAGRTVLEHLAMGDVEQAATVTSNLLEPSHQELRATLEARQDAIGERIDLTEAAAGRLGAATRLIVTLLIPAAAILVYRSVVKRQARRQAERLAARLRAEQELHRAKDEFIASISHEFRTPLTTIYGFSELLVEQGVIDPDSSMELITLINRESGELSRMVEDLLTAARLDAQALHFSFSELDPTAELEAVVAPLRRTGAAIGVEAEATRVWADQMRLHQLLRNLVSNALKYGGPHVTISTAERAGRFVCVVADDGEGVAPHIEERLFERFVHDGQEALLVGSVGLGLAIARALAEQMGGSLKYERVAGETRFLVDLPAAPPGAAADPPLTVAAA